MSNSILKGKKGIIFGALDSKSIAWKVAEAAKAEGAEFVLTNAPVALRMGGINELAEKTGSIVVPADATSIEDLKNLYTKAMDELGGKIDCDFAKRIFLILAFLKKNSALLFVIFRE